MRKVSRGQREDLQSGTASMPAVDVAARPELSAPASERHRPISAPAVQHTHMHGAASYVQGKPKNWTFSNYHINAAIQSFKIT